MSTKIYNAFITSELTNIEQVMNYLKHLKRHYFRAAVKSAAEMFKDTQWWKDEEGKPRKGKPRSGFWATHDELIDSMRKNRHHPFNYSASAVVIPHKGRLYIQFFGFDWRGYELLKPWEFTLTDFHYQNQTDEPEGMTEEEWEKRKKVWDKIYEGTDDKPSSVGLSFDFIQTSDCFRFLSRVKAACDPPVNEK